MQRDGVCFIGYWFQVNKKYPPVVAKKSNIRSYLPCAVRLWCRVSQEVEGSPSYEEFANLLKQGLFPWEENGNQKERGDPNCTLCKGEFYITCENCQGIGFLFIQDEDLWRTCEQCIGQGKNSCPVCDTREDNNDDWE